MSILTDNLPSVLVVNDEEYSINTDFRVWLKFSEIIHDTNKPKEQRAYEVLKLVFDEIPENVQDCMKGMEIFFAGNQNEEQRGVGEHKQRIFDFDIDAELIYSAFFQQYRIDLCKANLHWWQFKALFEGLCDDTHFIKVLEYRSVDLNTVEDKKLKAFYAKKKKQYALPDERTDEEKQQEVADFFDF